MTRAPYSVGENIGIGFMIYGKGDTWDAAFAEADANRKRDIQLPIAKQATRKPQERRSRVASTSSIPPVKPVTGQQKHPAAGVGKKRCAECGVAIPTRTRCPACALRRWRAEQPDQKRAQDRRYRAKNPKRVRTLVRARVAAWRKRNRIAKQTKGGA